ncbi:DUF2681 domain-containing protein [Paenibacillus sp. sptzw28]|nr:DUF2681 domain-containing protein [Paenibacillus sp. sptzw28]QYR23173.1 DUF2681 domain-containing protein [Paenibacillus sp. sptzw28]
MLDLYMILLLGGAFTLFYGFLSWCSQVIDEAGGEQL